MTHQQRRLFAAIRRLSSVSGIDRTLRFHFKHESALAGRMDNKPGDPENIVSVVGEGKTRHRIVRSITDIVMVTTHTPEPPRSYQPRPTFPRPGY